MDFFDFFQRFRAVLGERQLISFIFEEIGKGFPDVLVIVCYQDFFCSIDLLKGAPLIMRIKKIVA